MNLTTPANAAFTDNLFQTVPPNAKFHINDRYALNPHYFYSCAKLMPTNTPDVMCVNLNPVVLADGLYTGLQRIKVKSQVTCNVDLYTAGLLIGGYTSTVNNPQIYDKQFLTHNDLNVSSGIVTHLSVSYVDNPVVGDIVLPADSTNLFCGGFCDAHGELILDFQPAFACNSRNADGDNDFSPISIAIIPDTPVNAPFYCELEWITYG